MLRKVKRKLCMCQGNTTIHNTSTSFIAHMSFCKLIMLQRMERPGRLNGSQPFYKPVFQSSVELWTWLTVYPWLVLALFSALLWLGWDCLMVFSSFISYHPSLSLFQLWSFLGSPGTDSFVCLHLCCGVALLHWSLMCYSKCICYHTTREHWLNHQESG